MNNKIKYLLITVMLLIAVCFVASCSQWDTPYDDLDKDGYTVSVRFDPNGGMFAETENVYVVDVFDLNNAKTNASGKKEISLLAPNDSKRGSIKYDVSKSKSMFVGWYTDKQPRVDENGNPLDEYGVLTSVSGREQGYVYSGLWDFDTSKLELDPNKEYTSEENVLTLYAAWAPYFNYEIYIENENGEFDKLSDINAETINLPSWGSNGKMNRNSFPNVDGKTFKEASLQNDFAQLISGDLTGEIDYETGTIKGDGTIKVYTRYMDGVWFKITTSNQFKENSRLDGCYIIENDLDFTGVTWSSTIATGSFKGQIIGNGHKMSNITVNQGDTSIMRGGLFGGIDSGAVIENVTFENITYNMNAGSLKNGASFGLLAGTISNEAELTEVSISGTFNISSEIYQNATYSIGVLSGNVIETGVDISNITCQVKDDQTKLTIEVEDNGQITLAFAE
ncbi:MAG: hypothetical protein IKA02_05630 [Clostridia bacterium]|nr:hypothetical protein [Clostridia bacterium]